MKIKNQIIKQLVDEYKTISHLDKISAILNWDLNVFMPPKAAEGRGQQTALLTEIITRQWKNEKFQDLLKNANQQKDLNEEEKAI